MAATDYEEWVYRFRIEHPVFQDGAILILVRERCITGAWETQWLTREGWVGFDAYETLDHTKAIRMAGFALHHERQVIQGIEEAVRRVVREELGAAVVTA